MYFGNINNTCIYRSTISTIDFVINFLTTLQQNRTVNISLHITWMPFTQPHVRSYHNVIYYQTFFLVLDDSRAMLKSAMMCRFKVLLDSRNEPGLATHGAD